MNPTYMRANMPTASCSHYLAIKTQIIYHGMFLDSRIFLEESASTRQGGSCRKATVAADAWPTTSGIPSFRTLSIWRKIPQEK